MESYMKEGILMSGIRDPQSLNSIGTRIRYCRENLGLSRESFAELVSLSAFYIGQIERDERNMSIDSLISICDTLNVSIDFILRGYSKYMESTYIMEKLNNYTTDEIDELTREILSLLSGASIENIRVIKDMIKVLIPQLKR
ncbi:helix-turn-helix transcriptional regulator [Tissierella creatinini]|nr:helix-turn-helix transcriptional regulator [Tissierella creatinini]TJX63562.1 helix-turn-helix transcriptional regulator [Soehngenia saccharolytica]